LSYCQPSADGVVLTLQVIPRARKNAAGEVRDGRLVVRLTAPPVDDAANRELVAFLAGRLGVPARAVQIVSGERSRRKRVAILGITEGDCRRALQG
jgi:uncharacterized protein